MSPIKNIILNPLFYFFILFHFLFIYKYTNWRFNNIFCKFNDKNIRSTLKMTCKNYYSHLLFDKTILERGNLPNLTFQLHFIIFYIKFQLITNMI